MADEKQFIIGPDVGRRMKERRKELNMNAEAVAEKSKCAPSTIYRYEKGLIEKADAGKLLLIAEALQTTPGFLMGWTDGKEETADVYTVQNQPHTLEARIISGKVDSYPEETRKRILAMFDLLFEQIDDRKD